MKIRRLTGMLALLAAVTAFYAMPAEAAAIAKFGVVDLQKGLNATTEGMAAKETLKRKHQAKQEQIDAKKAELDAMEEKLKSPVLSESALAELKDRYRQKKAEIIEFVAEAKDQEEKENQQLSGRILEGLVEITREIGKAEGYTLILERSSSGVVFAPEALDLTERVVKEYNTRGAAGEKK